MKGFSHQSLQACGLYKEISSFKFEEVNPQRRVSTILFKEQGFEGDFVAFTAGAPGRDIPALAKYGFNDETASILMVNHAPTEHLAIPIGTVFSAQVTPIVDSELKLAVQSRGVGVSRRGPLVFTWEMRPGFAQDEMLVQLDVPLTIEIWLWPDYNALVSFFISPYLDGGHRLRARVAWYSVVVEAGILSGSIASQLQQGVSSPSVTNKLQNEVNDLLSSLDYRAWRDFYLLPGCAPVYERTDYTGNTRDDVTLVLVPQ